MQKEEILEIVKKAIPYSGQIYDVVIYDDSIRFNWRDSRYRVSEGLSVEEVGGGLLTGSDSAILMQHLIKRQSIFYEKL